MPPKESKPSVIRTKQKGDTTLPRLVVVFGDQLDLEAPLIKSVRQDLDTVLMMEVTSESTQVPSHVQRTVLFLSAMRHFAHSLQEKGLRVRYIKLDDPANTQSFSAEILRALKDVDPSEIHCTWPGEWRVHQSMRELETRSKKKLVIWPDTHFITSPADFATWAASRKSLTMEYFYREQRRATGYLVEGPKSTPVGGEWNFDADNRETFGKTGPQPLPKHPVTFPPDHITREVIQVVRKHLPNLPGELSEELDFKWPVTRRDALVALDDFVRNRLSLFGKFEDAMWTDVPFAYHSTLSSLLNLKLLNPRECCDAAIEAYEKGKAPLQSVEGFIRQIIGWREFIRGVYWLEGPEYDTRNSLEATNSLPEFFWTGKTDMACLRECIGQVIHRGYGHHIQRLMVIGNFALLAGIHPREVSDWFLGMYVDGVDWVTLPNVLGMVMHADRRPDSSPGNTGTVGTKPYAASGKYISRMSNYCKSCRFDPDEKTGPKACPFTVLYWDFLITHRQRLGSNQRMAMMLKNVDRLTPEIQTQLTISARSIRDRLGIKERSS